MTIEKLKEELKKWKEGNIKPNPAIILLSSSCMDQLKVEVSHITNFGVDTLCTFEGVVLKTPNEILDLTEI